MKLSLCMIVKNEAALLPQCLDSVKAWVDEMIIVDTGSSDRTIEIAQSFGATVYPFPWQDDFALARNESLTYAQGDWVLVLDADEKLLPEVIPALRELMEDDRLLVVNLLRQEVGAKQSPYSLVSRLFRNRSDLYFSRPYHETVDDSVLEILQREPTWKIGEFTQIAIHHEGYQAQAIADRNKLQRAQKILEKALEKQPQDAYLCSKLGSLYVESGNFVAGLRLLQQGLGSHPGEPMTRYELHYHLGIAFTHVQDFSNAEINYRAALLQPILPVLKLGAQINLGNLLMEKGDPAAAKTVYEAAVESDPDFAIAHYNLGLALKAMGRLSAAIVAYRNAIQLQPDYAEAYQNLGVALLKLGNLPESLTAFRQAIALHEQQHSPEAERLRQGLLEMGFRLG